MASDDIERIDHDAPGWDAITVALSHLYPAQEPRHFGTLISHRLGGPDPLDGLSAWKRIEPVPHWHIVTYGFSELYEKENGDSETSGYGFELTFRLACDPAEEEPPSWALNFLQNLARYVFETGNVFRDGDWMPINGPISRDRLTLLRSIAIATDPELPMTHTPFGALAFLQVVGITEDEERAAKLWRTARLLDTFRSKLPLLVTDLDRTSLLDDPEVRQAVNEGSAREGSSTGYLFTDRLAWLTRERLLRASAYDIILGARQVDELRRLLPLRLPFERPLRVAGDDANLMFEPADHDSVADVEGVLTLKMTPDTVAAFTRALRPDAASFTVPGLPTVTWHIEAAEAG